MMPKLSRIILPAAMLGTVATGCVTVDYGTPVAETAPLPGSTANPETPFITVTPEIRPTVSIEPTKIEATATVKTKVEELINLDLINKNIDDYLSGRLNYWGPNREYMFIDQAKREVEIGRTFRNSMQFPDGNNIEYVFTVAVMLGRVDNGEKVYVVLGSEKNGQRLVWLVNLGMADKDEYPGLSKVNLFYLAAKRPRLDNNGGGRLVYPDEMADRINDIMGRPIQINVLMNLNGELNRSYCGQLDQKECDVFYRELVSQLHFSPLSKWLDTGENFYEVKNLDCVVDQLSLNSIENIETPFSSNIQLPHIW